MIPILIAQVSTVGMNFMDSTMSGHVSANDLAGVSIGAAASAANGWYPTPIPAASRSSKEESGLAVIFLAAMCGAFGGRVTAGEVVGRATPQSRSGALPP